MGGLLDDESEDAEEQYRRIQAEQEAKNLGAVIGLAAGAAMALTQEQREDKEQQEHQPEQTMGGL